MATNHLYGYKWYLETDDGGEEQWCRGLVVSIEGLKVSQHLSVIAEHFAALVNDYMQELANDCDLGR